MEMFTKAYIKWIVANISVLFICLTHWGRATHICVNKLTIIGSDNGLSLCSVPSHYLNQCCNIINSTHGNKLQWNLNGKSYIFIKENAFQIAVCEMAAILSRSLCIKSPSILLTIGREDCSLLLLRYSIPKMQNYRQDSWRLCETGFFFRLFCFVLFFCFCFVLFLLVVFVFVFLYLMYILTTASVIKHHRLMFLTWDLPRVCLLIILRFSI